MSKFKRVSYVDWTVNENGSFHMGARGRAKKLFDKATVKPVLVRRTRGERIWTLSNGTVVIGAVTK